MLIRISVRFSICGSDGSDTERTGLTLGSDLRGSFQFGSRSAKVLMRSDTDGDHSEISEYQLLMKSLACQLRSGDGA